jgi:hypothetical protein
MISRIFKAFIFLLLAGCAPFALAQASATDPGRANPRNVDATQFGDIVTLGPDWLFAPGDDLAWASPAFDDSGWKTVSAEKPLNDYGYRDLHYAWYRIHVHLRPGTRNLMVGIEDFVGNYEVYANGIRLGGSGKMKERLLSAQNSLVAYAVPDHLVGERGDLVLAIRCAVNWGSSMGRGASTPISYESVLLLSQVSAMVATSYVAAHQGGPELLLGILALLAGLISFALYFALRSQQEYLAIGIYLLADSVMMALQLWLYVGGFSFPVHFLDFVVLSVLTIALIEFVRLVLHLPRTHLLAGFPGDSTEHPGNHIEHAQFGVFCTCPGDENRSSGAAAEGLAARQPGGRLVAAGNCHRQSGRLLVLRPQAGLLCASERTISLSAL